MGSRSSSVAVTPFVRVENQSDEAYAREVTEQTRELATELLAARELTEEWPEWVKRLPHGTLRQIERDRAAEQDAAATARIRARSGC